MRSSRPSARRRPSAPATDLGPRTTDKSGFTLLEVLMVVLVLTILIALLVPAISGGSAKARETQVQTEIQQLETALTGFRSTHSDVIPPSRITLYERGDSSANGWFQNTAEAKRSRSIIGRIWPQFDFTYGTAMQYDINGDGTYGTVTLTGAECLVFFIGGMHDSANNTMIGFAKNPSNPFSRTDTNRFAPEFEFDVSRLVDVDDDDMPEFVDTLSGQTTPYLYISSSYGGYSRTRAQRAAATIDDLDVWAHGDTKNLRDIYRQGASTAAPTTDDTTKAWNLKSFQIISAGLDKEYGLGGQFDSEKAGNQVTSANGRTAEQDNLTNFHGGRLVP